MECKIKGGCGRETGGGSIYSWKDLAFHEKSYIIYPRGHVKAPQLFEQKNDRIRFYFKRSADNIVRIELMIMDERVEEAEERWREVR